VRYIGELHFEGNARKQNVIFRCLWLRRKWRRYGYDGDSLRELVANWLGATSAGPICILLMRNSRTGGARCMHIQAQRSEDALMLFFFRHANGNPVFLPETAQPVIGSGQVFE
jgi:hypothetical protein